MNTLENLPFELQAPVAEGLSWINQQDDHSFAVTGVIGTEVALARPAGESFELGLVLCDGDICMRHDLIFMPGADGYTFAFADVEERDIPPLLDPPQGVRSGWLDSVLQKHEFVLLLIYRGLW